jgi:hypothetical protein
MRLSSTAAEGSRRYLIESARIWLTPAGTAVLATRAGQAGPVKICVLAADRLQTHIGVIRAG